MLRFGCLAIVGLLFHCGMVAAVEREVTFPSRGDDGVALCGRLHVPEGAAGCPGVVLVHPDPRYGGSMEVGVTVALQEAFETAGFATLRFNMRGVGNSSGAFDGGEGEMRDCLGALDFLSAAEGVNPGRVALAGYSFGSWVGLRACAAHKKARGCAVLAFPVPENEDPAKHPYLRALPFPALFVTGTQDPISSLSAIRRIITWNEAAERCSVLALAGADHFFWQQAHLTEAVRAIRDFIKKVCTAPPPPPEGNATQ